MVCFPKKLSMVPKNSGWYPKWWCGHFLNLKNHENWSSYKVCQGVGIPLGYYLGTIRHFGYHWGTILGTIMSNFCVVKNRFFEIFHIYRYTLGTEWYQKCGTPMVPKIFSLKSMKSQLSKTVSNVVLRCLDPYLQLFEFL